MNASPLSLAAYSRLLRSNRNFRLLWFAQIISETGDWLYTVAVYSLILELTGSARAVALAFVLQVLPQFFVSPAAGVLNDRLSRKKLMIVSDWARFAIILAMTLAQSRSMLPMLYVLLFLETIFWALFEPAHSAVIPNITAEEDIVVANGLSSSTWAFCLAIGSALGGFLAAGFGRTSVFVMNALSFILSALLIRAMRFEEPHLASLAPLRGRDLADFTPVADGYRYLARDPRLLSTMFVKCGLGLLGANWVILPMLGQRVFPVQLPGFHAKEAGTIGMSVFFGCRGLGALIGPLAASLWTGNKQRRFRFGILAGFLAGGMGYLLLSVAPSFPLACLCVLFAHAGGALAWVFSTTLLQIHTEDRFRGRVFSTEFAFSMLALAISSYSAGLLADAHVSVRTLAAITGAAALIPALLWMRAQRFWRGANEWS